MRHISRTVHYGLAKEKLERLFLLPPEVLGRQLLGIGPKGQSCESEANHVVLGEASLPWTLLSPAGNGSEEGLGFSPIPKPKSAISAEFPGGFI